MPRCADDHVSVSPAAIPWRVRPGRSTSSSVSASIEVGFNRAISVNAVVLNTWIGGASAPEAASATNARAH